MSGAASVSGSAAPHHDLLVGSGGAHLEPLTPRPTRARVPPGGHKKRKRPQDDPGKGPASGIPAGGPGWGGPARGVGNVWTPDNQPPQALIQAGRAEAKTAHEEAKRHAVDAVKVWVEIMRDPQALPQARVIAADKLVERAEGRAVQSVQIGGRIHVAAPVNPEDLTDAQREVLEDILLLGSGGPIIDGEVEETE